MGGPIRKLRRAQILANAGYFDCLTCGSVIEVKPGATSGWIDTSRSRHDRGVMHSTQARQRLDEAAAAVTTGSEAPADTSVLIMCGQCGEMYHYANRTPELLPPEKWVGLPPDTLETLRRLRRRYEQRRSSS